MNQTSSKGGSRLLLTKRDLEIFRLLGQDGARTSSELSKQFWDEKCQKTKAGFQRIRKLVETGFLEHGNPRLLYVTAKAGEVLIKAAGVEEVGDAA